MHLIGHAFNWPMANCYICSIVDRREELMCATSCKQQRHLWATISSKFLFVGRSGPAVDSNLAAIELFKQNLGRFLIVGI